jgi:hypothetical protein
MVYSHGSHSRASIEYPSCSHQPFLLEHLCKTFRALLEITTLFRSPPVITADNSSPQCNTPPCTSPAKPQKAGIKRGTIRGLTLAQTRSIDKPINTRIHASAVYPCPPCAVRAYEIRYPLRGSEQAPVFRVRRGFKCWEGSLAPAGRLGNGLEIGMNRRGSAF